MSINLNNIKKLLIKYKIIKLYIFNFYDTKFIIKMIHYYIY